MPDSAVTIAVLAEKIDALTEQVREMRQIARTVYRLDNEVENQGHDIERLERRINAWSALNSLGALLANILAVLRFK